MFKVVRQIGSGSTGLVYLVESCECDNEGEMFAIKEVDLSNLSSDHQTSALREAKIAMSLKHENIIRIYDASLCSKQLRIRMEYAKNGDLTSFLKANRSKMLPEDTIVDIFTQICLAVKYIHDRKIIHRDIKPDNIFISENQIIKLGDFGFARGLGSTGDLVTTTAGTPRYISPEIFVGHPYSFPADVWSLGCVLYELCTRRVAFEGDTVPAVAANVVKGKTPRVPSIYSAELRNLVAQMLRKHQEKRPTINQILEVPLIKYKAMALLGTRTAAIELGHTVFHGTPAGETPDEFRELLDTVNLDVQKTGKFEFMGRPLSLDESNDPQETRQQVTRFITKVAPKADINKLKAKIKNDDLGGITSTEAPILRLVAQLMAYENEHKLD